MFRRPLLALCLVTLLGFAASPALSGRLADLPWDDQVDQSLASGIKTELWKEKSAVESEKNAEGKSFVRFWETEYVELDGEQAHTYVTVQRCLADKMITEYWRYTYKKAGGSVELVEKKKLHETDTFELSIHETENDARASKAFKFQHDLMSFEAGAGAYIVGRRGGRPDSIYVSAKGRLQIDPLDEYERQFFERDLGVPRIDTEIEGAQITFHEKDDSFLQLVGAGSDGRAGASTPADGTLKSMISLLDGFTRDREYTPVMYEPAPLDQTLGRFTIIFETKDHDWIVYSYDPTASRQISISWRFQRGSMRGDDFGRFALLSTYYEPKARELGVVEREGHQGLQLAEPLRTDAMLHFTNWGIKATATVDLRFLTDTDFAVFNIFGDPRVRFVRDEQGNHIPFVPILGRGNFQFGATANAYRLEFGEAQKAGTSRRIEVGFQTGWGNNVGQNYGKIDESMWFVPRFGFIPFMGTLSDSVFMRLTVRSSDNYQHLSIGSKLEEEVANGERYTEWGTDHPVNFPTVIIGRYLEPVIEEVDGVKVTGWVTQQFGDNPLSRSAIKPHVEKAAQSIRLFNRVYDTPYPHDELTLIATPFDGASAQAPSSMVYIGQGFMLGQAATNQFFDAVTVKYVTPHELGHQWWGGIISNHPDHYWFVESLAEYSAALFEAATREDGDYPALRESWHRRTLNSDWIGSVVEDVGHFGVTGEAPARYFKGPHVIHMLGEYFGQDNLMVFLKALMKSHQGDRLTTADIQHVAEVIFGQVNDLGKDLDWFFDQWLRQNGIPEVGFEYDVREAEDGQNWIVTGKLSQVLTLQDKPQEGRYFENLLVPFVIDLGGDRVAVQRVIMKGSEQEFRFTVPSKPKKIDVNGNHRMLIKLKAG